MRRIELSSIDRASALDKLPKKRARSGLVVASLLIVALAGCAGSGGELGSAPAAPDMSLLEPAEQALSQARSIDAGSLAPQPLGAARRRLAVARDILYTAAREEREPTAAETARVERLVESARLDAQAAAVETQARAVERKLAELRAQSGSAASTTSGAAR